MAYKPVTREIYQHKIEKLVDYVHGNLDADLSLESLSCAACLSEYHLHRVYSAIMGETLMATVRRLRLQRAAKELVSSDLPIAKIAVKSGYGGVDAFSRKFREDFGITPNAYRKRGKLTVQEINKPVKEGKIMYEVTMTNLDDMNVAAIDHKGDYMQIGSAFEKLFTWGCQQGLVGEATRSFGIYYDDPNNVAGDDLRSKATFTVEGDFTQTQQVKRSIIASGKYASITHRGSYAELESAYNWFYGTWLVDSGEEPDDRPIVEEYLNNPRDTKPSDLLTVIYLPLK